jgi:hypothetical protein
MQEPYPRGGRRGDQEGFAVIPGFPEPVIKQFSKRSEEVKEIMEERNIESVSTKENMIKGLRKVLIMKNWYNKKINIKILLYLKNFCIIIITYIKYGII